ncbi:glycerophosphoryl diester phosphodiesterase [Jannaschia seohaensis]|uniref:glycerophosphodiester phosphodiesterase n=1 Tax=Jannaschia seohaensis TaxID=475081 RepID=A0A2Y9B8B5_9RHOB|nr:glycerophosphoryl diester phosphodiesterase [Jannaschia seohaensis]SSA51227.1 glycerophosphoryl diester phosphodiesterase [Jannaschia seohaensis]
MTFTEDHELVCRHAQNDLHTTTNILVSDLADTCVTPFTPASADAGATAECRTSELTLAEFLTLTPKMDAANTSATTAEAYQGGIADWRTDLQTDGAMPKTDAKSIALFEALNVDLTPELKSPSVEMPHEGLSEGDYAQKLVDEYKAAGINPSRVWLQSFNLEDVLYWIEAEPDFGAQAVYLMDECDLDGYAPMDPPTWMLVALEDGEIVPSALAMDAKEARLEIITWPLERSGPLAGGGGWYVQSIEEVTDSDGDYFDLLHVLAQEVGVAGVFSDWPATTTFYANCMGL